MKYMVMEVHKSYCIVLDEEGRFSKAANKGYEIGQTIGEIVKMRDYEEKKVVPLKAATLVASLAACLVLVFAISINQLPPVYGSVYLAINPEIRADVSKEGTVVSLVPLNEDADLLLDKYKGEKKSLIRVANELVDRAIELGFLSQGGKVSIDIDSPDELWFQETGVTLRQNLSSHIDERLSVAIEIKQHAEDTATPDPIDRVPSSPIPQSPSEPPSSKPDPKPISPPPSSQGKYITTEEALNSALRHAGVSRSDVKDLEVELDEEDGIKVYEIDFRVGRVKYDYEIDAMTAAIIKSEQDVDDDDD